MFGLFGLGSVLRCLCIAGWVLFGFGLLFVGFDFLVSVCGIGVNSVGVFWFLVCGLFCFSCLLVWVLLDLISRICCMLFVGLIAVKGFRC